MMCFGRSPTRSDEKHTPMISTTATKSGEGGQLEGSACSQRQDSQIGTVICRYVKGGPLSNELGIRSLTYCAILPV